MPLKEKGCRSSAKDKAVDGPAGGLYTRALVFPDASRWRRSVVLTLHIMKMKSLQPTVPILAGAVALLLGTLAPSAHAATNKRWTGNTGTPVWATLALGNWTGILAPTRIDTAIFGERFTPSPLDPFYRVQTDGSEVLLVKVLPAVPGPIAADLVFLNNWKLTERTTGLIGFFSAPLTLTGGFVTVSGSHTATIDADIIMASNQLTKLGSGTLLLERTVNGSAIVQEGVLGGNFTITGNLTNQATLSPGNSPGTVAVRRNFQQTSTGTLALEIASPTSYDHLIVNGSAKLDGDLNVALLNGYRPKRGQKFTFLSAGGGVSGEFDNVNAPVWDLLTLRPFYSGDSVALKAVVASFDALPGLTSNVTAADWAALQAFDVTLAPEPSAVLALGCLAPTLIRRRRMRR